MLGSNPNLEAFPSAFDKQIARWEQISQEIEEISANPGGVEFGSPAQLRNVQILWMCLGGGHWLS